MDNIQVRCIYWLVEFVEGIDGYVFWNEWLFWVFEGMGMLLVIGLFCIWYLGVCLKRGEVIEGEVIEGEKSEGGSDIQV